MSRDVGHKEVTQIIKLPFETIIDPTKFNKVSYTQKQMK